MLYLHAVAHTTVLTTHAAIDLPIVYGVRTGSLSLSHTHTHAHMHTVDADASRGRARKVDPTHQAGVSALDPGVPGGTVSWRSCPNTGSDACSSHIAILVPPTSSLVAWGGAWHIPVTAVTSRLGGSDKPEACLQHGRHRSSGAARTD